MFKTANANAKNRVFPNFFVPIRTLKVCIYSTKTVLIKSSFLIRIC